MRALRALCGLAALGASGAAAGDYEWPVMRVIDGATLVVDAGADFPAELAALTVRICQVVADVVVDGDSLAGRQ